MDNINNNKDTPTKKTSSDNDYKNNNKKDQMENTDNSFPEIERPEPSTATPSFPNEMPSRDYK